MPITSYYRFNYGISARVTGYALNPIMETKIQHKFHLKQLNPRTHTILLNQFKRGYRYNSAGGQVTALTRMLCYKFDLHPLPVISNKQIGGYFYKTDPTFKQWLTMVGLLSDTQVNTGQTRSWSNYEMARLIYEPKNTSSLTSESPAEFNKMLLTELQNYPQIFNSIERRAEAIKFIENKRVLIFNDKFG